MKAYDDIINMPHHESKTRKKMTNLERAAQFAPFAALTGYDGIVAEVHRLTDPERELAEDEIYHLNVKLNEIAQRMHGEELRVRITYFSKDEKKSGGSVLQREGYPVAIDEYEMTVKMKDGEKISIRDMLRIEIFKEDYFL